MRLILSVYGAALCLGNLWKCHAVQQSSSANAEAVTVLRFSAGLNITDRKKKQRRKSNFSHYRIVAFPRRSSYLHTQGQPKFACPWSRVGNGNLFSMQQSGNPFIWIPRVLLFREKAHFVKGYKTALSDI